MITESILDVVFGIAEWLLEPLPEIAVPTVMARDSTFFGMVRCALYLLPLDTVGTIVGLLLAISTFRFIVSLLKTIWDFIPFV